MATLSLQAGSFGILLNQAALPMPLVASIGDVEVQNEISVPGMFSFVLNKVSPSGGRQGANLDRFKPGDQITILLGLDKLQRLIEGEIAAIEPRFGEKSTAIIRGFDRMHRLQFGTWSRPFENLTDKQIAVEIAKAAKIDLLLGEEMMKPLEYVKQEEETNYHFLRKRCDAINFELIMEGTALWFRASAEGGSPIKTLTFPRDVSQVDLDLKVPTQGCKVTVTSLDPVTNKPIFAETSSGTVSDRMGGKQTGYDMAERFPESAVTVERLDLTTVEALQVAADARYQLELNRFIEATVTLVGDPELNAGVNIKLTGLSDRFDGIYYIISSTHSYDESTGYQTKIKLRRTGA
jgi:uncharacterized protein